MQTSYRPPTKSSKPVEPKLSAEDRAKLEGEIRREHEIAYLQTFDGKLVKAELRGGTFIRGIITGYHKGLFRFSEAEILPQGSTEWEKGKNVIMDRASLTLIFEI